MRLEKIDLKDKLYKLGLSLCALTTSVTGLVIAVEDHAELGMISSALTLASTSALYLNISGNKESMEYNRLRTINEKGLNSYNSNRGLAI